MRRTRTILAVSTVAATLALTGCSSDSSGGNATAADSTTTAATTTASSSSAASSTTASSATATAAAPSASAGKVVPVNLTIDDPEMGDHTVIESMVRDFPVPASLPAIADREIVLVKVTATAGSKYYAGWQASGTQIVDAKGGTNSEGGATAIEEAMTAAGYPPLANGGSVKTGQTGSGWLSYVVKVKDTPNLTFRIKRGAATTSGGGTIAAKNFDVPLPA